MGRILLKLFFCVALIAETGAVHGQSPAVQTGASVSSHTTVSFETDEGTVMSVDWSPRNDLLVFDLLGDLYIMPVEGGRATPITSGTSWDRSPIFSEDGGHIYFVSDRNGHSNIWRVGVNDRLTEQVSFFDKHVKGHPNFLPEGRLVVGMKSSSQGEISLRAVPATGGSNEWFDEPHGNWFDMDSLSPIRDRQERYSGVQAFDGSLYFDQADINREQDRISVRLYRYDPKNDEAIALATEGARFSDYGPQVSNDRRKLSFLRQYPDRRIELWVRNLKTGSERRIAPLGYGDDATVAASEPIHPNYTFSPDDRFVLLSHGGGFVQVDIQTGEVVKVPFSVLVERDVARRAEAIQPRLDNMRVRPSTIRWPEFAPEMEELVYVATGYLWRENVETGHLEQLTGDDQLIYMPSLSPDGKSIVYTGFDVQADGYSNGKLRVLNLATRETSELLNSPDAHYLLPRWSADGRRIALIEERKVGNRLVSHFGWTNVEAPSFSEVATSPSSNNYFNAASFSRYVGFDQSGEKLLFSYRVSDIEMRLIEANLENGLQSVLAIGGEHIHGMIPSPNLASLAFVRSDETIWLRPLNSEQAPQPVSVDSPEANNISPIGGYFVDWIDSENVSFGLGPVVYRHSIGEEALTQFRPSAASNRKTNDEPIAFVDGRIVTMAINGDDDQIIEAGTIVVENGRISALGASESVRIPENATIINASGRTIIPGLIDSHYHRIGGGGSSGIVGFKLPRTHFADESALGFGITVAWEPGGVLNDGSPAMADLVAASRVAGPRWTVAASGGAGFPWEFLDSYEAALVDIRRHQELGVHILKEYSTPTRQQQQWLVEAARAQNMAIVAHIDNFDGMMTRIVDGYTGGDHPYIPTPFYKDVAELLRHSGFVWTPNIAISTGSASSLAGPPDYWDQAFARFPQTRDRLKSLVTGYDYKERSSDNPNPGVPYVNHRVSRVAEQAARAAQAGVNIGMSAHNMAGANLHAEMWYLWRGGLPALEVLRATTMGNAQKLGLQNEVGSLEVGKIADFVILDSNPLDDIMNTLSVRYTIQNGVIYDANNARRINPRAIAGDEEKNSVAR